jgi:hypothetical protein
MVTTELDRILAKGWVVQCSKQTPDTWDVKMAISAWQMDQNKYIGSYGFAKSLDEALLSCESGILNRWDELHPEVNKAQYGAYD